MRSGLLPIRTLKIKDPGVEIQAQGQKFDHPHNPPLYRPN